MTTPRTLLAVHAHPDDESSSTGGVLARYGAEGVRTIVITCTRGEVGEIADPALATLENLAEVRAQEMAAAAEILGLSRHVQLSYRDSGMAGTPDNDHPDSFNRANLEEATRRVVEIVRAEKPQVIITYDENGGYGHPDHIRAHQVAVAAFEAAGDPERFPDAGSPWSPIKLYYSAFPRSQIVATIRAWREAGIAIPWELPEDLNLNDESVSLGVPDDVITTEIDVSAYLEAKYDALRAHRTQIAPDNPWLILPMELGRPIWSKEYFRLVRGPGRLPAGDRETDLFAGT